MQLATHFQRVEYPVAVEPKIDGVRCWIIFKADRYQIISRRGNIWNKELAHLARSLKKQLHFAGIATPCVFDGELFAGSFGKTISSINRGKTEAIEYHIFDVLESETGSTLPYQQRREKLERLFARSINLFSKIKLIESTLAVDENELMRFYQQCLANSYEGVMIKKLDGNYKTCRRTNLWQKLNPINDASGYIVDIKSNGCPIVKLDPSDGGHKITV